MTLLKCPRCNNVWDYAGQYKDNPHAQVNCPACHKMIKIADNKARIIRRVKRDDID